MESNHNQTISQQSSPDFPSLQRISGSVCSSRSTSEAGDFVRVDQEQQLTESEEDMDHMEIENEEDKETSKKVFTNDQWECDLKGVKILKEDMNRLVMNYLVSEGNLEAIEKFQKESRTKPEVEFASITDVYEADKSGNIEDAIERLNVLNPEILKTNPEVLFHLQLQRFIELIRDGRTDDALKFSEEKLAPYGVENATFLKEVQETTGLLLFEDSLNCP